MTRGKPLSDDLRWALVSMGLYHDTTNIAQLTGVPQRSVERTFADYRKHATAARQHITLELRGRKSTLKGKAGKFLRSMVQHSPDVYLDELRDILESRMDIDVDESTIWRHLTKCGYTMKKLTRLAIERNEIKRAQYRFDYGLRYTPEQTVFVDESSFDRRTSIRGKAWALSGERAERKCFFVRGRRYSMLPAMGLNGILHVKIVEGSFTAELFYDFIESLLNQMQPFPNPNSVIVLDNARIHKSPDIQELIEERGMKVMYLPPYSPDLNPIELAFSKIKSYVRRAGELGRQDVDQSEDDTYVYVHLIEAAYSVTSDDAEGFFHHCGYI